MLCIPGGPVKKLLVRSSPFAAFAFGWGNGKMLVLWGSKDLQSAPCTSLIFPKGKNNSVRHLGKIVLRRHIPEQRQVQRRWSNFRAGGQLSHLQAVLWAEGRLIVEDLVEAAYDALTSRPYRAPSWLKRQTLCGCMVDVEVWQRLCSVVYKQLQHRQGQHRRQDHYCFCQFVQTTRPQRPIWPNT